jgi:hypothetical protein
MLAYLFWHQPAENTPRQNYEQALVGFHRRLREVPVAGFVASGTARVRGLPWMPGDGYEDWYAVDDYTALGVLNDAAVDASHLDAHDLVAHAARFGAGGLYVLEQGEIAAPPRRCVWLTKPVAVGYPSFREQLAAHTAGEPVSVWRRQMVLGPSPEFRVTADREPAFPAAWAPVRCELERLPAAPSR